MMHVRAASVVAVLTIGAMVWGATPVGADHHMKKVTALKLQGALNRGDADAALEVFAEDARVTGAECETPCEGAAEIREGFLEPEIADGARVLLTDMDEEGNQVNARFRVRSDSLREAGVRRLVGPVTFTFDNGHVAALDIGLDETDPETARFLAAFGPEMMDAAGVADMARADGREPSMLPATGDGSLAGDPVGMTPFFILAGLALASRLTRRFV